MSYREHVNWEDENGALACEPESRATRSRRAVLGGAAGAFALVTGGLLLPGWLTQDADAADRPLQGVQDRQGQQRQKRRHRLAHRREVNRRQRDKKANDDKPRGGIFDDPGIEFRVELTGGRPVDVDLHEKTSVWRLADQETLSAQAPLEFFLTNESAAALWIDDRFIVRADPGFGNVPEVVLGHGGTFTGGQGWRGGTLVSASGLQEGEESRVMQVDGYTILAKRLGNAPKAFVYKVTIAAPA